MAKEFPLFKRNELAEGGCARAIGCVGGFDEIKWPLKKEVRVGEWDGVGPCNKPGGVGNGRGGIFYWFTIVDDAVFPGRVTVPERRPSALMFGKGFVGGWGCKEVAIINSGFICIVFCLR